MFSRRRSGSVLGKRQGNDVDRDLESASIKKKTMVSGLQRDMKRKVGFRLVLLAFLGLFLVKLYQHDVLYKSARMVTTVTRPMWDYDGRDHYRWMINYGWSGNPQESCRLHGMEPSGEKAKVYDIVLLSEEWDMLEIRMHELAPVVEKFVLVQMPCYFNGEPRTASFKDMEDRYARFKEKIVFYQIGDSICKEAQTKQGAMLLRKDPRFIESKFRAILAKPRSVYAKIGGIRFEQDDLIVFADLDEIPRRSTIELLRSCKWPEKLHRIQLQLSNFLYGFEFRLYDYDEALGVIRYNDRSAFIHGRFAKGRHQRPVVLAEAGWHCSWCLSSLRQIANKMQSYGHSDRLRDPSLLRPEEIRRHSCIGKDPFDYEPEGYTFSSVWQQLFFDIRLRGTSDIPKLLQEQPSRFLHLLPGGCDKRPLE